MNGKGDKQRPTNKKSFDENYNKICWQHAYRFQYSAKAELMGKSCEYDSFKCVHCGEPYIVDRYTKKRLRKIERLLSD